MSHLSRGSVGERGGGGKGRAAGPGVRDVFPHEGAKARSKEGAKGIGCHRARRGEARSAAAGGGGLCRGGAGGYFGGAEAGGSKGDRYAAGQGDSVGVWGGREREERASSCDTDPPISFRIKYEYKALAESSRWGEG